MPQAEEILGKVERYYTRKFSEHGPAARGVDWNSAESQELRFVQLLRCVASATEPYSIIDFGCGYGALADYLTRRGDRVSYLGVDLSVPMLDYARRRFRGQPRVKFSDMSSDLPPADYVVASGIFNLKFDYDDAAWTAYVIQTIQTISALGTRGFAFNMLTKYSDADRMRADLYYADPSLYFDLCKRRFSRNVALLHDYDLYEFTL